MSDDCKELKLGKSTATIDGDGNIVAARVGETRMAMSFDDGVPDRFEVFCEKGTPAFQSKFHQSSLVSPGPCISKIHVRCAARSFLRLRATSTESGSSI